MYGDSVLYRAGSSRGSGTVGGAVVFLALLVLPAALAAAPRCRSVSPAETNREIDPSWYDHYTCFDPSVPSKNLLFVFFAGTRSSPERYTLLTQEAARSGLHAISLAYRNRFAVNLEICPFMENENPRCHEQVRQEIIYGTDSFAPLEISPAESIVGRLSALLTYLHHRHTGEGWSRFLSEDNQPVWSSLVVSGHSQGGGHATMIARDHRVARLIIFAWTDRLHGELAPWLRQSFATPASKLYAFVHLQDRIESRRALFRALGMDRFAPEVQVDVAHSPYGGSHILSTNIEAARPHSSVVNDSATPLREDGTPVLMEVWKYLLDVAPTDG